MKSNNNNNDSNIFCFATVKLPNLKRTKSKLVESNRKFKKFRRRNFEFLIFFWHFFLNFMNRFDRTEFELRAYFALKSIGSNGLLW